MFILGDGPLKEELETYLKEHKLTQHIFMEGNVENVEQYLAEADAFVLSSNYEGLPLVILEAMASGLPIVSTDVGGVKDVVTDNGLLVEPHSIEKLASAMMQIKANAEMRKDFSEEEQGFPLFILKEMTPTEQIKEKLIRFIRKLLNIVQQSLFSRLLAHKNVTPKKCKTVVR